MGKRIYHISNEAFDALFDKMQGSIVEYTSCLICKGEFTDLELHKEWLSKRKEPKMTREEAKKKLIGVGHNSPNELIKYIEALGLIKFDEDIKPSLDETIYNARIFARDTGEQDQSKFIAILNTAGYEIVKKS